MARTENFDFDYGNDELNSIDAAVFSDSFISKQDKPQTVYKSPVRYFKIEANGIQKTEQNIIEKHPDNTFIHQPAKILVQRPPTEILIHHAPVLVKPSPVVFHQPGKTILRPVLRKLLPQKYEERTNLVRIIRPIEQKVLVPKTDNFGYGNYERFPPYFGNGLRPSQSFT